LIAAKYENCIGFVMSIPSCSALKIAAPTGQGFPAFAPSG